MRSSFYFVAALLLQCCSAQMRVQSRTKALEGDKQNKSLNKPSSKPEQLDATQGGTSKTDTAQTTIEASSTKATVSSTGVPADKGMPLPDSKTPASQNEKLTSPTSPAVKEGTVEKPGGSTPPTSEQMETAYGIRPIEMEIFNLVNEHRKTKSLPPFAINAYAFMQARVHSENMAKGITPFGHDGFNDRLKFIAKSIGRPSFVAGENVTPSGGSNAAANALKSWLSSAGHRGNIEGDFSQTGLGVGQNEAGKMMFTQIFLKL
jgi:uncharacterized protein YkwD